MLYCVAPRHFGGISLLFDSLAERHQHKQACILSQHQTSWELTKRCTYILSMEQHVTGAVSGKQQVGSVRAR